MESIGNPENTHGILWSRVWVQTLPPLPWGARHWEAPGSKGRWLRLRRKVGQQAVANPLPSPGTHTSWHSPFKPWGSAQHCGVPREQGHLSGSCTRHRAHSLGTWACSWVRAASSGPGVIRAAPESESSLTGHQPSGHEKLPLLYVHYRVICGSYNKFIIPVFVMSLSLCPLPQVWDHYPVRYAFRAEPDSSPWRWPWMPRP